MTPTLSVIVATIGRPSLARTLAALVPQLGTGDEVLVMVDGPADAMAPGAFGGTPPQERRWSAYWDASGPHGDWGHHQRNRALTHGLAHGSHILFIDDDDVHVPDALSLVRAALVLAPDVPHLFKVCIHDETDGGLIWHEREVREGNVSTQMIVAPNVPAKLGRFGNRYAGDYDFIRATVDLHGGRCVFDEAVIADIYPARER